jgi:AbiV family abortive infection protein
MRTVAVTEQTLLQGAWYALEQAGQLLDSAVTLIDAGHFSTSVGVAMFGREELGRYKILRRLATEVAKGGTVSVADVQSECDDHEEKQQAATLSMTMRPPLGSRLGEAIRTLSRDPPSSPAWQAANNDLQIATDAKVRRAPAVRHQLRMSSLYVDLREDGNWNRPLAIFAEEANNAVMDAVSDYSVQRERLLNVPGDAEMAAVMKTMNPVPDVVPPRWPSRRI